MPGSGLSGQAQTVLGPVAGEAMGITLPHEHLLIDFAVMFKEPGSGSERGLARQPVSLANLGWVRQNFSSSLDNLQLLDEAVARDEALLFKHAGYHHLLVNVIPRLRAKGADDKTIQTLLIDNPRRAFVYA